MTIVVVLVAACALAASSCGGDGPSTEAADTSQGWALPNADLANTRMVDGPIGAASVDGLRVAWRQPLEQMHASTPVGADGVVYTQDLMSNVTATELDSGDVLWTRRYDESDIGPNGVNVTGDRVYGATRSGAFALDRESGEELWFRQLIRHPNDAIDMAPGVHHGMAYISTAVAGPGAVGTLWALDAETGAPRWQWETVPSDLWGRPEVNSGGGLWHTPAFDERGNMYVSVANPLPYPGTDRFPWGSSRPGDNRWTNSIVKLRADTGEFLWGRQVLPHDIYDWDLQCPVILARANGRAIAIVAGKMGRVYAFDRADGRLLWERAVGVHNGRDDDNLLAMRGQGDRIPYGTRNLPGDWGGVETQMASDGETVYVPVNDLWMQYLSQTRNRKQDTLEGTGEIVALDVATGDVRWKRPLPHGVYGATTISSDLVFTTTYEGTLWALSRRTGEVVWRDVLPAGSIAPPAILGDTLVVGATMAVRDGQQPALVAYRLP